MPGVNIAHTPANRSCAARAADGTFSVSRTSGVAACVCSGRLAIALIFLSAVAAAGRVIDDACRVPLDGVLMAKQRTDPPPKAEKLPFRITRGGESYALELTPGSASGPSVRFDRDKGRLLVKSEKSAADLVSNLRATVTAVDAWDRAEAAQRELISLTGQVEELGRLVEAALPARDPLARRFASATLELSATLEAPGSPLPAGPMLHDAMDHFDSLAIEERRRILNGWTPAPRRPSYAELHNLPANNSMHRVLSIDLAGRQNGASWDYRLDDSAGVHPVRVLLTEGVSKRQVLDALREATELVANEWAELVGGDTGEGESIPAAVRWFHGSTNEKGEASPMPNVPALAGNRNEKGVEAKPADLQHSR
jgi:hypothetical protein